MSALEVQIGGDHYKTLAIQPVEYVLKNGIGFIEGCVIKYVSRWKAKGGVADLRKARHFLDMLIEHEDPAAVPTREDLINDIAQAERRLAEMKNALYESDRRAYREQAPLLSREDIEALSE